MNTKRFVAFLSLFLFFSGTFIVVSTVPLAAKPEKDAATAKIYSSITDEEMGVILKKMGFVYEMPKENVFRFKISSVTVLLINGETNLQFYSGFSTEGKVNCEKVNEWNRDKRYSRAYIDSEGDVVIEADLDLEKGVTEGRIENFLYTCRLILDQFVSHIQ